MASRTKQKEEARARRVAEEQARAEKERRTRRFQMLGGVLLIAVAVVAVAIAVSSGGGGSAPSSKLKTTAAKTTGPGSKHFVTCQGSPDSSICSLLAGIPQSGNTLGNPHAKVTVTEFGDLECSACDDFALGSSQNTSAGVPGSGIEDQLIQNDVRSGKAKLVFRSLETASQSNPNPNAFLTQQTASESAGLQDKQWYYIELFYHYQGQEGTGYMTQNYLNTLAKHVPGLNYAGWQAHLHDSALQSQVQHDELFAASRGYNQTPTVTVVGPKGQAQAISGVPSSYGQIESEINAVQ